MVGFVFHISHRIFHNLNKYASASQLTCLLHLNAVAVACRQIIGSYRWLVNNAQPKMLGVLATLLTSRFPGLIRVFVFLQRLSKINNGMETGGGEKRTSILIFYLGGASPISDRYGSKRPNFLAST